MSLLARGLLVTASLAVGLGADDPSPVGDWKGTISPSPVVKLPLVLHVTETPGGGLAATFDSPDQGTWGIPVATITFKDRELVFEAPAIKGRFVGTIDEAGKEIPGVWFQTGDLPLKLTRAEAAEVAPPDLPAKLDGLWEGTLKLGPAMTLRLVLRVKRVANGPLLVAIDSPDQGANGIPVSAIAVKDGTLTFESKTIQGNYSGKLDLEGGSIVGEWKQGGAALPLVLKKTDKMAELRRPQLPKGPFPYRAEDVSYPNASAKGVTLAGTLTLPEGDGPFPAAVFITGSGPQDRDESLMGHKPFLVLADHLSRRGVAVLRVDDRGVGKSTGDFAKATSADFATDARAGIAYLRTRKEIDPKRIGLIGHSEGGLVGPMVAAEAPDEVAFLVLMAGPGVTGGEILTLQRRLIGRAQGAPDAALDKQEEVLSKLTELLRAEVDDAKAAAKMAELASTYDDVPTVTADIALMTTPWFRYFLDYDPRPTLAKVRCPVLAVNGEKDLQVPPKEDLAEVEKALRSGGNDRVTIRELPGLNHLFQTAPTGSPAEYGSIEETISPTALEAIATWIAEVAPAD